MLKEVKVEGMTCGGCANAVQKKFSALEGVQSVQVDLENKKAIISSEREIDQELLKEALADTSYTVVG